VTKDGRSLQTIHYNSSLSVRSEFLLHTTADNCEAVFPRLVSCIEDIGLWMSSNRLKLNAEKTQFTCLGTRYQLAKIDGSNLLVNWAQLSIFYVQSPALVLR